MTDLDSKQYDGDALGSENGQCRYPNTRASKLPQHIKDCLTERSVTFLQRYCTFQVCLIMMMIIVMIVRVSHLSIELVFELSACSLEMEVRKRYKRQHLSSLDMVFTTQKANILGNFFWPKRFRN